MYRLTLPFLLFFALACTGSGGTALKRLAPPDHDSPPPPFPGPVQKLIRYYPQVVGYADNRLLFADGSSLPYDDGRQKTFQQLLDSADIEDQFRIPYRKGPLPLSIPVNEDPGRIRNEAFFKKIYGATREEVRGNLVEITWCPKTIGQKLLVTRINGVDQQLQKISEELDALPAFTDYVRKIGGTFNWRLIKGTNRLSLHSFGMTIDINTAYSHYWQWDCKCTSEEAALSYRNRIPAEIVAIFEKHGFIWGGRWYHYDTMHFEYRPELMEEQQADPTSREEKGV